MAWDEFAKSALVAGVTALTVGAILRGYHRRAVEKAPFAPTGNTSEPIQRRELRLRGTVTDVTSASREPLQGLKKVKVTSLDPINGSLSARTGMTWESFGERIEVRVTAAGRGLVVASIESRPRAWTTEVDAAARNFINVETIAAHLRRQFAEA